MIRKCLQRAAGKPLKAAARQALKSKSQNLSQLSAAPCEPFLFLAFNPLKTGGVMDALVAET